MHNRGEGGQTLNYQTQGCIGLGRGFQNLHYFVCVCVTLCWPQVSEVISSLEDGLQLLCLTWVEDQLQSDVRPTLELLRDDGIRVS